MLKAGIMEDYVYTETEEGSGQGSVCSPIIANIYMHYVLVWWFKEAVAPHMRGYCGLVVYADYTEVETMPKKSLKYYKNRPFPLKTSA